MRIGLLASFSLLLIQSRCGRASEKVNPKHIETPQFPSLARTARTVGEVNLRLTIDANGNVVSVEAIRNKAGNVPHPLLEQYCEENVRKWTFSKPSRPPVTQNMIYDFQIDDRLTPTYDAPIEKTYFDLPDRVRIVSNNATIEP